MTEVKHKTSNWSGLLTVATLSVALTLASAWPGIWIASLFADDANYLAGLSSLPSSSFLEVRPWIVEVLMPIGLPALRVFYLVFIPVGSVLLFLLAKHFFPTWPSTVVALLLAVSWFDPNVGVFVTGSNGPPSAVASILIFLLFVRFLASKTSIEREIVAVSIGIVGLFSVDNAGYAAALGLIPLVFVGLLLMFRVIRFADSAVLLIASFVSAFWTIFQQLNSPNHYWGLGWVDSSITGMLGRIPKLLGLYTQPFDSNSLLLWLLISLVSLGLIVIFHKKSISGGAQKDNNPISSLEPLRTRFTLLITSFSMLGASMAPVLAVNVGYGGRYGWAIWASFIIFVMMLANTIRSSNFNLILISLSIGILLVGGLEKYNSQSDYLGKNAAESSKLVELIEAKSSEWEPGSQIVVITDQLPCCGRFNHWSTGVMREISGRNDLYSLIGTEPSLSETPLVERNSWSVAGWWTENSSGQARREPMKGLEVNDGPVYLYDLRQPNFTTAIAISFESKACSLFVKPGNPIQNVNNVKIDAGNSFIWEVETCEP